MSAEFNARNANARESIVKMMTAFRKSEGLTKVEIAKRLDIPYWTYVKYENGKRMPSRFAAEYLYRRISAMRAESWRKGNEDLVMQMETSGEIKRGVAT